MQKEKKLAFSERLMKELVFYGSYHNNKWNQLIHAVFVPAILWSTFCLLCQTGELVPLSAKVATLGFPPVIASNLVGNAATMLFVFYMCYYLFLDLVAGAFFSVIMFGMLLHANHLFAALGATLALKVALGVNILGWYMQIHPGHGIFEGRKPALIDSFWQALLTAPFFAGFEVLFAIGYAPATRVELQRRVDLEIAKYKAASKQK